MELCRFPKLDLKAFADSCTSSVFFEDKQNESLPDHVFTVVKNIIKSSYYPRHDDYSIIFSLNNYTEVFTSEKFT